MRLSRGSAALGALAAASLVAAVSASPARRAVTRHVLVSVTDKNGKAIVGLAASAFSVREDGQAREVLGVGPAAPPSTVALLVDNSAAAEPVLSEVRSGVAAFLRGLAAFDPAPETSLVTLGGRPATAVDFTTNRAALGPAAGRIFSQPGTGAYLLDGIVEATQTIAKRTAPSPVVVAFDIESGDEFGSMNHDQVAAALRSVHAALWTIVLQSEGAVDLESTTLRERALVLDEVTKASGGGSRQVLSRQGIDGAFADVIAALGARYDVMYSRPDALIPPRKLDVQVKAPNARVAAPSWPSGPGE